MRRDERNGEHRNKKRYFRVGVGTCTSLWAEGNGAVSRKRFVMMEQGLEEAGGGVVAITSLCWRWLQARPVPSSLI